ncbi:ABC transporter substrate-binding protein [Nocardia mikamii]|uniref:ABC transporter substrate-binding protein n=1 Tax=Nocardia mikamii TaxID=508464 RepID=UPI0007A3DF9C|nr:ABC transporter substrate-binding protein [Nocardia mikamii]
MQLLRWLAIGSTVASLVACGPAQSSDGTLTLTNCGEQVRFPAPAQRMFVNDTNMVAMTLALGAQDSVAAVAGLQQDVATLRRHYGDVVDRLDNVAPSSPSRETVLARRPDVMVAGWNYGYSEATDLTPDTLRANGITPYILTESCRPHAGRRQRGTVEPWAALRADLSNLGAITGHPDRATALVADIDTRLQRLRAAPRAATPPTLFVFDTASETIFSSGRFGGPQAVLEAAGARNALDDVADTWTAVSWERLAAADPDALVFVDYPGQTFAQKVDALRAKPGINRLRAVTEQRFLDLPYVLWTSSPLNIDAAEQVRAQLERWNMLPPSDIRPAFDDAVR